MQKIGIYGGSFDPVHRDHVAICEKFYKDFDLDFVLVIPAKLSPFKSSTSASPERRLKMLEIACANNPKLIPCDIELKLDGVSYSYKTVQLLREKYPDACFYFLMGGDSFCEFHTWTNPQVIASECEIVVANRVGENIENAKRNFELLFNKQAHFFDLQTDLAGSYIRELLKLDVNCSEFLPNGVYEYIKTNNVYIGDKYYEFLKSRLNEQRLKHVGGVAYLAEKYAKKIGESADKAHIAGLLHDVAKNMQISEYPDFAFPNTIVDEVPRQVVHQFLGAYVAEKVLGISDLEVLDAIRWHTTGRPNMSKLEKIVFIADLLEPSRNYAEVDLLRRACEKDFESGFLLTLKHLLIYLKNSGQDICKLTALAYDYYKISD